jgi:hypothetical protein
MKSTKSILIKKWVMFSIFTIMSLVVPIIIISTNYKLFTNVAAHRKLTAATIILILILLYVIKNWFSTFVKWLAPGALKMCIIWFKLMLPFIAIVWIVNLAGDALYESYSKAILAYKTLQNTAYSVFACEAVGALAEAYYDYYTQIYAEIKLTKRQDKYRKEYKL